MSTVHHILSPIPRAGARHRICGAVTSAAADYDGIDAAYRAMAELTAKGPVCLECANAIWLTMGLRVEDERPKPSGILHEIDRISSLTTW